MSKIAIVAAMEREVRPLVRDWLAIDKTHDGRQFRFFETGRCGGGLRRDWRRQRRAGLRRR